MAQLVSLTIASEAQLSPLSDKPSSARRLLLKVTSSGRAGAVTCSPLAQLATLKSVLATQLLPPSGEPGAV